MESIDTELPKKEKEGIVWFILGSIVGILVLATVVVLALYYRKVMI